MMLSGVARISSTGVVDLFCRCVDGAGTYGMAFEVFIGRSVFDSHSMAE